MKYVMSSFGVLLLMCILLIMLDIRSSSSVSNTYKQKHKVFVPDTIPMELSPDSITSIKFSIKNDQIWN